MKKSVLLKRGLRALVSLLFVLSLPVFMVGCGHDDGGSGAVSATGGGSSSKSSLKIELNASSIGVNTSKWLTAYYTSASGKTVDVSSKATWNSSDGCARVEGGLLTGVSIGETVISASCYDCTAEAHVSVVGVNGYKTLLGDDDASPEANGVNFLPGTSKKVRVYAHLSDGSKQDITDSLRWSSSDETIAKVSADAVVTAGCTKGSAELTGRFSKSAENATDNGEGKIVAQFRVNVSGSEAELVSIAISEAESQMPAGTERELTLIATYDDGNTADVTLGAEWASDADEVASVQLDAERQAAKVTSHVKGTAIIGVTFGGKTATWTADVTDAALTGLYFYIDDISLASGLSHEIRVMGTFTDNNPVDVTSSLRFTTDNGGVAFVDEVAGKILAVGEGCTVITAETQYGTYSASMKVTVVPAVVNDIGVDTSDKNSNVKPAVVNGGSKDSSDVNPADTPSANPTVNPADETDDSADTPSTNDTATPALDGINVATSSFEGGASANGCGNGTTILQISKGMTEQFTINAFYSDSTTVNVTDLATFSVSPEGQDFVTVSESGLVTAVKEGEAVVVVTYSDGVTEHTISLTIKVGPAALTALRVTPPVIDIPKGLSQKVKVEAFYSDDPENPIDVTSLVTFSVTGDNADSFTVDNAGNVTSVISGDSSQTEDESQAGSTTQLEVTYTDAQGNTLDGRADLSLAPAVATRIFAKSCGEIGVGESMVVSAAAKCSDNEVRRISGDIEWTSSDENIISIDERYKENNDGSCFVKGVSPGTVTITATYKTETGTYTDSFETDCYAEAYNVFIDGPDSLTVGDVVCYYAVGSPDEGEDANLSNITPGADWTCGDGLECLGPVQDDSGNVGMAFRAVAAGSSSVTIESTQYLQFYDCTKNVNISERQAQSLKNPFHVK